MSTSSDYSLTHLTCQHVLSGIGRYGLELCRALRTSHPELEFYKTFKPGHPDSFLHEEEAWIKKVPYQSFRGLHPYVMPWYVSKAVVGATSPRTCILPIVAATSPLAGTTI